MCYTKEACTDHPAGSIQCAGLWRPQAGILLFSEKYCGIWKKIFSYFFQFFLLLVCPWPSNRYHIDTRALTCKPFRQYARNLPKLFADFSIDPPPKNAMKRNEKCQKTSKNKEYRNNRIVSAFVHHEEIPDKYLISKLKTFFRFFCFSPNLIPTKKEHSVLSGS